MEVVFDTLLKFSFNNLFKHFKHDIMVFAQFVLFGCFSQKDCKSKTVSDLLLCITKNAALFLNSCNIECFKKNFQCFRIILTAFLSFSIFIIRASN